MPKIPKYNILYNVSVTHHTPSCGFILWSIKSKCSLIFINIKVLIHTHQLCRYEIKDESGFIVFVQVSELELTKSRNYWLPRKVLCWGSGDWDVAADGSVCLSLLHLHSKKTDRGGEVPQSEIFTLIVTIRASPVSSDNAPVSIK